MGDPSPVEEVSGNMAAQKKRARDTFLSDAERGDYEPPAKRPSCSESLSSRVTTWLSQLPPESPSEADLDMARPLKENRWKGKSNDDDSVAGGQATPSIASASDVSRPATATGTVQTESTTSTRRLVEQPDYRSKNLAENNIHLLPRTSRIPLPKYVSDVCDDMRKPGVSPAPTPQELLREMARLGKLQNDGAAESRVEDFFKENVFPTATTVADDGLELVSKPTFLHCIPNGPTPNKVSRPVPYLVYGYDATDSGMPFSHVQKSAGAMMDPRLGIIDSGKVLSFPFFVIEFKGDGPMNGNLWVATNQCLGSSAACTEAVIRLNDQLKKYPGARPVSDVTFSIAMSQNEAQLYVSWKTEELQYYTREAAAFYIRRSEEYQQFRRYVKNIIDWGKGPRLQAIKRALDAILEGDRKVPSVKAQQRPAPSSASGSSPTFKDSQVTFAPQALGFSSSHTVHTESPRPAAQGSDARQAPVDVRSSDSLGSAQPSGYQSPSAASSLRSFQPGSHAGGGPGSNSGCGDGRDRSPHGPDNGGGITQSRRPDLQRYDGRSLPPTPSTPFPNDRAEIAQVSLEDLFYYDGRYLPSKQ
ncbi:hypothetical protein PG984_009879 [Apiospora sp. TS-2023a]